MDMAVDSLFKCLADFLKEKGMEKYLGEAGHLGLLASFDYFTKSEKDCPGLGKKVKEILGE
jgi:hypothetical protein